MTSTMLTELKKLQYQRSGSSPFSTHIEFLTWSDNVTPLLAFDGTMMSKFKRSISLAKSRLEYPDAYLSDINDAIGILNQSVLFLETPSLLSTQSKTTITVLAPPDKVTVKWLYEHANVQLYSIAFGVVISAFGFGFWVGSIVTSNQSVPLSKREPIATVPTSTIIPPSSQVAPASQTSSPSNAQVPKK